jgi:hypothetical protein
MPLNIEDPKVVAATVTQLMDRIDALEAKTAADAASLEATAMEELNRVADKLFERVGQLDASIDQGIIASSNGIQQILTLMRRLDGATVALKLGPEAQ